MLPVFYERVHSVTCISKFSADVFNPNSRLNENIFFYNGCSLFSYVKISLVMYMCGPQ